MTKRPSVYTDSQFTVPLPLHNVPAPSPQPSLHPFSPPHTHTENEMLSCSGSLSEVPGPSASASPGNMSEI